MKLRRTILKNHSWYLCQILLQIMLLPIPITITLKKRYCLSCIAPSDGLHEQTLFCGGVRSWNHVNGLLKLENVARHRLISSTWVNFPLLWNKHLNSDSDNSSRHLCPLIVSYFKSALQRFAIDVNHLSKRELRLIAIRVVFQATLDI